MWTLVNSACSGLFDLLLWPVSGLAPGWQAFYLGIPGAMLALAVYRGVSNQQGIERAKDRIWAHILEMRLYKDDFLVSLRAQGSLLKHNLRYLSFALLPMAVMIVPFLLMLVQIESRFAFRSLRTGETALLTLAVDLDGPVSRLPVELSLPDGLEQETPALRIDETGEVVWRLRGKRAGTYDVHIRLGDSEIEKQVRVAANGSWVATELYRASDWTTLLYPQEPPLPADGPAASLRFEYPRARGDFAGLSSASWIFFGSSMLFGFALRGLFGVTF